MVEVPTFTPDTRGAIQCLNKADIAKIIPFLPIQLLALLAPLSQARQAIGFILDPSARMPTFKQFGTGTCCKSLAVLTVADILEGFARALGLVIFGQWLLAKPTLAKFIHQNTSFQTCS
jgi:hypothetical protein